MQELLIRIWSQDRIGEYYKPDLTSRLTRLAPRRNPDAAITSAHGFLLGVFPPRRMPA